MLVNYQRLIHGVPFGPWELPSSDSLIKAAEHVREALAIVAYMRALERAGTFISPGNSVPLERQSALLSSFSRPVPRVATVPSIGVLLRSATLPSRISIPSVDCLPP